MPPSSSENFPDIRRLLLHAFVASIPPLDNQRGVLLSGVGPCEVAGVISIGIKLDAGTNACQMIYLPIGMKSKALPAKTGRPRAFDPDAALERAMHVFWAKGYEGVSLSDLTRAMRINRPNLYAAFGNKEELFGKVLDRYMDGPVAW
jgi:Bacterial regulatory proteins, tetR family